MELLTREHAVKFRLLDLLVNFGVELGNLFLEAFELSADFVADFSGPVLELFVVNVRHLDFVQLLLHMLGSMVQLEKGVVLELVDLLGGEGDLDLLHFGRAVCEHLEHLLFCVFVKGVGGDAVLLDGLDGGVIVVFENPLSLLHIWVRLINLIMKLFLLIPLLINYVSSIAVGVDGNSERCFQFDVKVDQKISIPYIVSGINEDKFGAEVMHWVVAKLFRKTDIEGGVDDFTIQAQVNQKEGNIKFIS